MQATLKKAEVGKEGIVLTLAVGEEEATLEINQALALNLGNDIFQVIHARLYDIDADAGIAKVTYTFGEPGHYKIEREPVEGREMEYVAVEEI